MITPSFEIEQLEAWMELLTRRYESMEVSDIGLAEGIHILIEPINESFLMQHIDNTKVLIINSHYSPVELRRTLLWAIAAERAIEGKELLIRVSTN